MLLFLSMNTVIRLAGEEWEVHGRGEPSLSPRDLSTAKRMHLQALAVARSCGHTFAVLVKFFLSPI